MATALPNNSTFVPVFHNESCRNKGMYKTKKYKKYMYIEKEAAAKRSDLSLQHKVVFEQRERKKVRDEIKTVCSNEDQSVKGGRWLSQTAANKHGFFTPQPNDLL